MITRPLAAFCFVQLATLSAYAAHSDGVRVDKRITVTNQMAGLADASRVAAVWGVAFSPDQRRLAAGVRYGKKGDKPPYYDKSFILIFDIATPEQKVRRIELSRPPAINVYPELFWSSDGRYVATAFYGDWSHAAIADLSTNELHIVPSQNCRVKGILAGPQVALTCFDGHVRLLAADGTAARALSVPDRASILNVDSNLGNIAVHFSRQEERNPPQRDIAVIHVGDLKEVRRWALPPGKDSVFGTFAKAGTAFCALEDPIATSDRTFTCWDVGSGTIVWQQTFAKGFTGPIMGAGDRIGMQHRKVKDVPKLLTRLAETTFVFTDPSICIWDLKSGRQVAALRTGWLQVWAMSPTGDSFAICASGLITIYRVTP